MGCLRCGKETDNGKTFCDACLASMDAYPVKPDEAVYLPPEKEAGENKKQGARRKTQSLAQQLEAAKRRNRILSWLVAVLLIAVGVLCGLLFF